MRKTAIILLLSPLGQGSGCPESLSLFSLSTPLSLLSHPLSRHSVTAQTKALTGTYIIPSITVLVCFLLTPTLLTYFSRLQPLLAHVSLDSASTRPSRYLHLPTPLLWLVTWNWLLFLLQVLTPYTSSSKLETV